MSPRDRDDEDRPKKSWREIDRQRDHSRHVSASKPEPRRVREQSHQSRAALERAFRDGLVARLVSEKGADLPSQEKSRRPELVKKIRMSEGRAEVNALLDELLSFSTLPDDWDVLVRALDHHRPEVVKAALEQILKLLATERPARKASLVQRVKGLAEGEDEDLRELAEKVRAALG
jgi:hypothetical protein